MRVCVCMFGDSSSSFLPKEIAQTDPVPPPEGGMRELEVLKPHKRSVEQCAASNCNSWSKTCKGKNKNKNTTTF